MNELLIALAQEGAPYILIAVLLKYIYDCNHVRNQEIKTFVQSIDNNTNIIERMYYLLTGKEINKKDDDD